MLRHYEKLKQWFETTFPRIDGYTRAHRRVIKYVLAGGTAAATNILSLFILVHFLGMYYIVAAVISWVIAFCVSFILQKFWTFGSRNLERAHKELVIYLSVSIASLIIDTYLLYVFVEFLHIHYLVSQVIIGLGTAVVTYSINKFIIFKKHHPEGKHVILIAASNYPPEPGGPATHAKKYYEEFSKLGHEVRLVVFSKLHWLPAGIRHLVYAFLIFRQSFGANIVYVMDPISSGPAAYVAWLLHKPYIIRLGGDVVWERAASKGATNLSCLEFYNKGDYKHAGFYRITKFVLHHAEKVVIDKIFDSLLPLSNIYPKYYDVPESRIVGIPNPLPAKISPVQYSSRSVVFASRLVKYKNLDMVIENWPSADTDLYIMGDGPEQPKLKRTARVKIMGTVPRDRKDELLKKCMMTLAPALTEFNPNYVLEGFAVGKPTLMSRENGLPYKLPEIMLFDPRNIEEFVAKLNYLLSEAGYKEAQEWVQNLSYNQAWDDVIKKNLEIINEVCAS